MKRSLGTKFMSFLLAFIMTFSAPALAVKALAAGSGGKYISDVFIATGEKTEDAEKWLRDNGYEPIGNLNEGKDSSMSKHYSVSVLGIKRTDDPEEAITDMAVMNMNGGYSFDDYDSLVKEKKADIDEFIYTFVPALEEYRENYNNPKSEGAHKRAVLAHDLLNKFYDGDPNGEYAVNDTGKPLGDLLLNKTKTEIGDDAYNALSAEEKLNTGDLQQIILESLGNAVIAIEQILAVATDTGEDTWLQRLQNFAGQDLVKNIGMVIPEAEGMYLAPSAAKNMLTEYFGDYAKKLAAKWTDVHDEIVWFEDYCAQIGLDPYDEPEKFVADAEEYFAELETTDEVQYNSVYGRFLSVETWYFLLLETEYPGAWGNYLYDFYYPMDEDADYSKETDYFLAMAAALSPGQRAALDFLSMDALLRIGVSNEEVDKKVFPSVDEIFAGQEDSMSVYSGMNRAIFRRGVALTSDTLRQKNSGKDPYADLWDINSGLRIAELALLCAGAAAFIASAIATTVFTVRAIGLAPKYMFESCIQFNEFEELAFAAKNSAKIGKIVMGIGAVLMLFALAMKAYELIEFYNRTFTQIPIMIVDEHDIVSYTTGADGQKKKLISFDQFMYYDVVKCNRQEVGINGSAQSGVDLYEEWGCGDAADINADVGKEWLALYVNKSSAKGNPILASTLEIVTNTDKQPENLDGCLHFFGSSAPAKLDDTAYCYTSSTDGMYLYWATDANAFTASAFNAGYMAIAALGGLALGIVGTTVAMSAKKKKDPEPAAA